MLRGLAILLLLGAGIVGCTPPPPPHADKIPEIPPGRGAAGPGKALQPPVAPPAKQP